MTHQKALAINLDRTAYGTFAEIGAGQEVARWFFHVGKASGTVAKTISAYDMTVSDAIYGPCERYVSRQRLQKMLDYEYALLLERLQAKRGPSTRFLRMPIRWSPGACRAGRTGMAGWGSGFSTRPKSLLLKS